MRILIVSQYFWPENFRVNDLAEGLMERGHEVTVLTGVPNYPEGAIFPEYCADPELFANFKGAEVVRVPTLPRARGKLRLALNYLAFAAGGMAAGPARLKGKQFDAIFVFQTSPITAALPALRIARQQGAPVFLWVLDVWPDTLEAIGVLRSQMAVATVGALVRYIYRRCAKILLQARDMQPRVERWGATPAQTEYFPGWAEGVFDGANADFAPEMCEFTDGFTMLFAGNIGEAQDFPSLIAAMENLRDRPEAKLVVLGGGRGMEAARAEVARRGLGDRILFLGRFPIQRMPAFFAAADALVVSLVDEPIWAMTVPGKVQSYLASGRPILAMLSGEGGRVVAESGGGLAAPAGDPAVFAANARVMMAKTEAERAAMGAAGQAYGREHFDRGTLICRLEGWMREEAAARA